MLVIALTLIIIFYVIEIRLVMCLEKLNKFLYKKKQIMGGSSYFPFMVEGLHAWLRVLVLFLLFE